MAASGASLPQNGEKKFSASPLQENALKLASQQPASAGAGHRVHRSLQPVAASPSSVSTGEGQSSLFADTTVLEVVADAIRQGVAGAEAARVLQRGGFSTDAAAAGAAADETSGLKFAGRGGGALDTTVAPLPVLRDLRWRLDWLASSSKGAVGEPAAILTFIVEDPPAARADERSAAEDEASHGGPGPAAARFRTVEVGCGAHRLQSLLDAVEAACRAAESIAGGSV